MKTKLQTQQLTEQSSDLFKYQALFDSNMIGVASTDFSADGIIEKANDAFLSMLGYTQQDLRYGKLRWSVISPQKYDEADDQKIEELFTHTRIVPFEKEYIHKNGHPVPVLVGAETLSREPSFGVCFALDITPMKEQERKKDDFIGTVSHELKTPLSIMRLYSDFLKNSIQENASKEELYDSVNEITSQIDKLSMLITDLLNMARYKAEENLFPMSTLDLCNYSKRVVSEISLLHDRSIIFQGEKAVFVKGNQARLTQVVTNLVNNARRYSSNDTDIIVRVFKNESFACVEVEDFGMGISIENQEKIFERHYRINHADGYPEGAGIGLYICNEIVRHHKGTISVKSELGKGSVFTVKLPLV